MKYHFLLAAIIVLIHEKCESKYESRWPTVDEYSKFTSFVFYYGDSNGTIGSVKYASNNLHEVSSHVHFNTSQSIAIPLHGYWVNYGKSRHVRSIVEGFVLYNKMYNVIVLDWSEFAFMNYTYEYASEFIPTYSKWVGHVFYNCSKRSVDGSWDASKLYLIGTSLGSQIGSAIARGFYELSGRKVARVTGLDPILIHFETFVPNVKNRLTQNDAEFVDIVHTDAGLYGIGDATGHVDFWPNGGIAQPGCPLSRKPVQSDSKYKRAVQCNHIRPVLYFIESVSNVESTKDFFAIHKYPNGTTSIVPMGINCPTSARGNYYLKTAAMSPFSLGLNGTLF